MYTTEFRIFKDGVTDKPVSIMSRAGEYFNRPAKIEKYINLGYTILPA